MILDSADESDSKEYDLSNAGEDVDVYCNHYRIPKLSSFGPNGSNNSSKRKSNRDQIKCSFEGKIVALTELAAQKVACHLPFGQVEHFSPPVPEPMQCRIAFWSFPQDEEDIRLYTCLANGNADVFMRAEDLIERNAVRDMLQVGFHLSANVQISDETDQVECFGVALTFDRRRITTCSCSCMSSTYWCSHLVAVCLQRIRKPHDVTLRAPVSESLQRLEKDQLQKFAQYLINELPQQILPAAQKLLDELLSGEEAVINQNPGAPDPTAGATINEQTSWCLDYNHLSIDIQKILLRQCTAQPTVCDVQSLHVTAPPASTEYSQLLRPIRGREPEGLWNLFSIVGEMMKRRDSNFLPLLEIITEETLKFDKIVNWWFETKVSLHSGSTIHISNVRGTQYTSQYSCSNFCDEIVHLWRLAAMNPSASATEREKFFKKLYDWHMCVLKRYTSFDELSSNSKTNKRNILELFPGFKPAMEGSLIDWTDWDDKQSKIVSNDGVKTEDGKTAKQLKKKRRKLKAKQAASLASSSTNEAKPSTSKTDSTQESNPTETLDCGEQHEDLRLSNDIDNAQEVQTENNDSSNAEEAQNEQLPVEDPAHPENPPIHDNPEDIEQDLQVYFMEQPPENADDDQKPGSMEDLIKVNQKRLADPLETLYAKTEGLYAHGYIDEARKLARKAALSILNLRIYPSLKQVFCLLKKRKKRGTLDNQMSIVTSESLTKILFLCNVLMDCPENQNLIFRLVILGIHMKRSPAATKPLEVKLINQKQELLMVMKCIALHQDELEVLRGMAQSVIDSSCGKDLDPLTTLLLGSYLFKALTLSKTSNGSNRSRTPSGFSSHHEDRHTAASHSSDNHNGRPVGVLVVHGKLPSDSDLGLQAALHAISVKNNVLETDHPLLCEGLRRQRGDLALLLITHYKDDQDKLDLILKHLLDKDVVISPAAAPVVPTEKLSDKAGKKISTQQDPNMPTEASAHFMFELAKTVFDKAGGNSLTAHLFRPQIMSQNGGRDIHRNLHMCTLRIALHSLGLANCTSTTWMQRTYSGRASFIHEQALEIGLPAIKYLRENWEGYLTPVEAASIADKAGCSGDIEIKRIAAEMAKSCLKFANFLDLNAVTRILVQCKDQTIEMIESACNEIEQVAETDGVCADVLFATARAWYDLYTRTFVGESRPCSGANVFQLNVTPTEQDTGAANWSLQPNAPTSWEYTVPPQFIEPVIPPIQWDVYGSVDIASTSDSPIYSNIDYLKSAYRVGIKALDALKLSQHMGSKHNPKKVDEILWLLELSKSLGRDCLHKFSQSAIKNITDPHILEVIISDIIKFFQTLPADSIDRINILLPLVDRCLERCLKQTKESMKLVSQNQKNEIDSIIDVAQNMTTIANNPTAAKQFREILSIVDNRKTKRYRVFIDTRHRHNWLDTLLYSMDCGCNVCWTNSRA